MSTKFEFPVSTPEAQGLSSRSILNFIDRVEEQRIAVNSLILMRHGHVVAEGYWAPFGPGKPHRMFSAGKAVVMLAVLFAMQEGKVTAETRMADIFPDKMPAERTPWLEELNLGHLLSMTTGHGEDTFAPMLVPDADRVKVFFELPLCYQPGTHFLYNNGVPDILQYLLQRVTGEDIYDYLKPRLFDPLDMSNYRAEKKEGGMVELPTMAFETRDLFKFALLLHQGGVWEGRQLLDPALVQEATRYHAPSFAEGAVGDHGAGYCWQMWRNMVGGYRIDGGQGQFGVVIPEADLVVGINSAEPHQDAILQVLWEEIETRLYSAPLPADPEGDALLEARLRDLTWAPKNAADPRPETAGSYTLAAPLMARTDLSFEFDGQELSFTADGCAIRMGMDGRWTAGRVPFLVPELGEGTGERMGFLRHDLVAGADPADCIAAAAWTAPNTLELHFRSEGWMGYHVFRFVFGAGKVTASHLGGMDYALEHRAERYIPAHLSRRPIEGEAPIVGTKR